MTVLFLDITHASAMANLHRTSFESAWQEKDFVTFLSLPTYVGIGWIDESGDLKGFALYNTVLPELEICTLCVDPNYRRRGIAKMIFEKTIDKIEGIERCFLEVADTNQAAISLYSKLGFSISGIRKDYYKLSNDRLQDAILMDYDIAQKAAKTRT